MSNFLGVALLALAGLTPFLADAGELKTITIVIKDEKFVPSEIEGPANVKFKLVVKNEGKSAEEFESHELNREKVIAPGQTATIFLGPLPAGTYPFFGEFHPKTAQGKLILK